MAPNPAALLPHNALQHVKAGLGSAVAFTTMGVGLKAIGSAFRLHDLKDAPDAVFNDRLKQETALLLMVGAVTMVSQLLLPLAFKRLNVTNELAKNVWRTIMIAPGYMASEVGSRMLGDISWEGMIKKYKESLMDKDDDDNSVRTLLKQLTDFLYKPNAKSGPAQAFGQKLLPYNPANYPQQPSLNVVSASPLNSSLRQRAQQSTTYPSQGASKVTHLTHNTHAQHQPLWSSYL